MTKRASAAPNLTGAATAYESGDHIRSRVIVIPVLPLFQGQKSKDQKFVPGSREPGAAEVRLATRELGFGNRMNGGPLSRTQIKKLTQMLVERSRR